jgi:hypothetical protein
MSNRKYASAAVRKIADNVEDTRYIEFVASDSSRDSYKTVLPLEKWDLDRFNKNGVIGYQHNLYYSTNPDMVIGTGKAFVDGNQLIVGVTFEPAELNPIAEKLFRKILHGTIKAVSVGFDPIGGGHWGEGDEYYGKPNETYYYDGMELLEVSIVHIPANKNAVKRALEDLLSEDDPENEPEVRIIPENTPPDTLQRDIEQVEKDLTITEALASQQFDN